MPIREYECVECGFRTERIEYTDQFDPITCPRCAEEIGSERRMKRVISIPADPHFVGSGWTGKSYNYNAPKGTHPVPAPKENK